jgi:carboxyl-terminal processing protease
VTSNDKKKYNGIDEDSIRYKVSTKVENFKEDVSQRLEEISQKIIAVLPPVLVEFLATIFAKIKAALPNLKIAVLSFSTGAVLMLAAILVPVYNSVENLSQPVTLFETILADLDAGYVDPVDTNKLFETGVSAMLKSLDPYTEFEAKEEAQQMNEGIMGRYGGVGLVISGATPRDVNEIKKITGGTDVASSSVNKLKEESTPKGSKLLPDDAIQDSMTPEEDNSSIQSSSTEDKESNTQFVDNGNDIDDEDDEEAKFIKRRRKEQLKALAKAQDKGIQVVSAFEGYAFDYGMRTGDRLIKVDDLLVEKGKTSVEDVRNVLRGSPGTLVNIQFERDGINGVQEVTMPRTVVRLRDVKLATLVGKPSDGIGYISLSGFAASAGNEVRGAILALEQAAEDASNGQHSLKGLILDMRGNPGGLLTSAVDVASLLVPNGSDIVSAKGRGFPGVTYRSKTEPLLDKNTKLAVLVNRGTASAAEIVSGAVQDLDVGIIVGSDRTFGKGLVQNVEDLPFNTALKFTVAKYYTPSGRCIQSVNYNEGGVGNDNEGKYTASRVSQKDRQIFYTKSGRTVRDGGGVEADYKIAAPKASALEITLLRSDILNEYASKWSQKYQLTNNFEVTDDIYKEFQDFVDVKAKNGEIKLEAIYLGALEDLKRTLSQSGYKSSEKEVDFLKTQIVKEVKKDFEKYKKDIKEDIATSILSRYVPESMIMERGLKTDTQVQAAIKLLGNDQSFSKILAKGSNKERSASQGNTIVQDSTVNLSLEDRNEKTRESGSFRLEF